MSTKKKKVKVAEDRVAIVCEPLFKHGGAEVHLKYILETFPNSEVYTAFYDKEFVKSFYGDIKIHHSFMQYLFNKIQWRQIYLIFQPVAYRLFKFKGYDSIISFSIAFSKFIKAKKTKHINICMTPPKFLWEKEARTLKSINQLKGILRFFYKIYRGSVGKMIENRWRKMDLKAAQGCTKIVAISNVVKERIKKYYGLNSDVIYPPVEVKKIKEFKKVNRKENWFLYHGRVETYKGVDLAIRAAVKANVPLKISGMGDDLDQMKKLVKKLNAKGLIKFLGYTTEEEKINLLSRSKALVFPVKGEDFGIVPVEANAAGTPVIAYKDGGVTETISEYNPKTGIFFDKYDVDTLSKILREFKSEDFSPDNCRKQANNFASEIFTYRLQNYVREN
ncbi:MAG: glycosyltransferase [Candidatus Dojkabacteria bacterium]|nr:glycosyltransferase [Candidatus Dojkabacteria bacterium]